MTTDAQNAKIIAAVQPLYADADFAGVSDLNVAVTQLPAAPSPVTDNVDVPKA